MQSLMVIGVQIKEKHREAHFCDMYSICILEVKSHAK